MDASSFNWRERSATPAAVARSVARSAANAAPPAIISGARCRYVTPADTAFEWANNFAHGSASFTSAPTMPVLSPASRAKIIVLVLRPEFHDTDAGQCGRHGAIRPDSVQPSLVHAFLRL